MNFDELKLFLDEKFEEYNHHRFIETDPIQIPHQFTSKEDIEIIGFLIATIAWGNRKSILKSSEKMVNYLEGEPYNFILNHTENDLKKIEGCVHRTFNSEDLIYFIKSLQNIYKNRGGLEKIFSTHKNESNTFYAIERFRKVFFEILPLQRTQKHVSSPLKNSSSKRINMYLRWMVRKDNKGVDFGLWQSISPSQLMCPLDIHSGNTARTLKLLNRNQNDWKSVVELTNNLKKFDKDDPVKYDYSLFGLGVFENFVNKFK
ncbi:TIGR02757 family protein [Apibacter muscae]|uniref:TIGR02757 family protein n=1 Tax=Apibacter muscae TaxID=2509004 RepID=A0A563D8X1_9FLAO|nr:TIGR02757 family protein [Apibacter muscae]TWP26645.1 TIGR02757 family protein [Apibacter muscae]TWP28219.1 TIGR02757 family protein [Apibacter muscae]